MTDTTAHEGYERIKWADVRKGDVLFHENGDRLTVRGVGERSSAAGFSLGATSWQTRGFTPYRRKPELPTTPGAYLDKDGNVWLRDDDWDGKPWIGQGYSDWLTPDEVSQRAPFTRLVPVPSSASVLEVVKGIIPLSRYEAVTDAVMALLEAGQNGEQEVGS